MNLIIATRNKHKLGEIRELLAIPQLEIVSALDFPHIPDTLEDGATFVENALKKADELCRATGIPALADDSGLEVDALNGAPGVFSARYAGQHGDNEANNRKLLRELENSSVRTARFRCVMALALPDGTRETVSGTCEGTIAPQCRGTHGFGYDPLFIPEGYTQTFGELDPAIKATLSHRARALQQARIKWHQILAR
jgi:XTP/dITP diphosphohydrolase